MHFQFTNVLLFHSQFKNGERMRHRFCAHVLEFHLPAIVGCQSSLFASQKNPFPNNRNERKLKVACIDAHWFHLFSFVPFFLSPFLIGCIFSCHFSIWTSHQVSQMHFMHVYPGQKKEWKNAIVCEQHTERERVQFCSEYLFFMLNLGKKKRQLRQQQQGNRPRIFAECDLNGNLKNGQERDRENESESAKFIQIDNCWKLHIHAKHNGPIWKQHTELHTNMCVEARARHRPPQLDTHWEKHRRPPRTNVREKEREWEREKFLWVAFCFGKNTERKKNHTVVEQQRHDRTKPNRKKNHRNKWKVERLIHNK